MRCNNCGLNNDINNKNCIYCNTLLNKEKLINSNTNSEYEKAIKMINNQGIVTTFLFLICLLLIFLLSGADFFGVQRPFSEKVNSFLKTLSSVKYIYII